MLEDPHLACLSLQQLLARSLPSERDDHSRKVTTGDHEHDPSPLLSLSGLEILLGQLQLLETRKEVGRVGEVRREEGSVNPELGVGEDGRWWSEPDEGCAEGRPV